MQDTVFVPSFGNPPRNLVGREDTLRSFENLFQSVPGSRERVMLLLGQRGSGKTVLLLQLAELARKRGYVVASPTIVSKELPTRILEKLKDDGDAYLDKPKPRIVGGNIEVAGTGGGIVIEHEDEPEKSFSWRLSRLCSELNKKKKPVLILVDEVQANQDSLRELIVAYQEMVGQELDVSMALAGLPATISSVLNDHVLTFLNRAVKIQLTPLRIGDIEYYYRSVFSNLKIKLTDTQISTAAKETDGSPYMMQLIGHYLVLGAEKNTPVSDTQFEAAIQTAKNNFMNDICQTTLAPLSDKDISFLAAMAVYGETAEISDIIERLQSTNSTVQTYKRRLVHAGIIVSPKRGTVQFAVPYLRDYLYQEYAE